LGLVVLILIFYFGQEAQVMAWTITGLSVLFSGVFYPVTILPPLVRPISYSIPLTYAFIAWREVTLLGASIADVSFVLLQMGVSSVIWLVITWSVCLYTIKRARKIGMISQLSA
jgi:ABC-2 type transport system permease protein